MVAAKRVETRVLDEGGALANKPPPSPAESSPDETAKQWAQPDGSISVPLIYDVPVFDEGSGSIERVKVLKFRKPTGLDLLEIGNPVVFDALSEPPRVEHKTQIMLRMMSRLSDIPYASLAKMDTQDMVTCFWALTPNFMPRLDV